MKKLIIGLNAAITTSLATSAFAHDFFLLPGQFTAPVAESQVVQASVGSNFPTPKNVVTADRVDRLFAAGAGKPQLSVTWPGAKALNLRVTGASRGMVVAAVKTKDRDVEYAEDRITLILEEYRVSPEAAAAVAAAQNDALGLGGTVDEVERCVKALFRQPRLGVMRPLVGDPAGVDGRHQDPVGEHLRSACPGHLLGFAAGRLQQPVQGANQPGRGRYPAHNGIFGAIIGK